MIESVVESFYNNLIAEDRYRMILDGLQVTLLITLCAALLGTLLGGLVCWMRMSHRKWLQQVAKVYIELMRGTPVLVLLMLMYYVDFTGFMEDPEKVWNEISSTCDKPPLENKEKQE